LRDSWLQERRSENQATRLAVAFSTNSSPNSAHRARPDLALHLPLRYEITRVVPLHALVPALRHNPKVSLSEPIFSIGHAGNSLR
jgi:hypothetical protein